MDSTVWRSWQEGDQSSLDLVKLILLPTQLIHFLRDRLWELMASSDPHHFVYTYQKVHFLNTAYYDIWYTVQKLHANVSLFNKWSTTFKFAEGLRRFLWHYSLLFWPQEGQALPFVHGWLQVGSLKKQWWEEVEVIVFSYWACSSRGQRREGGEGRELIDRVTGLLQGRLCKRVQS